MKKLIDHAADHAENCITLLTEARNVLRDTEDSPHFKGNITELRESLDELDSIIADLEGIQSSVENIDLTF